MNYEPLPGMDDILDQIQEKHSKTKGKTAKAKRWQDSDGDGKWYEPGQDVKESHKESYDLYDIILSHLLDEGYADTEDAAESIMVNMSEEWKQSIVEGDNYDKNRKRAAQRAAERNAARDRGQTGAVPGVGYVTPRREKETYVDAAGTTRHKSGAKNEEFEIDEATMDGKDDNGFKSCWKGYVKKGTKMKGGKEVNDCKPANEELQHMEDSLVESGLFSFDEIHYIIGERFDELDEATAMAKRGYDETEIRTKIAKNTGGGKTADKATALADRQTYGNNEKKAGRENLARKQRGDFRKTTSSSPGLHGYGHKSDDPKVKAKQAARGAQRGALTPNEKKSLGREGYQMIGNTLEEGGLEVTTYSWHQVLEQQYARNNPEKYEAEQKKKTPKGSMPPRGDKRREEFEKWYAANVK
jgi:hypothetical protein